MNKYSLTLKSNDVYQYYHFHDADNESSEYDEWNLELLTQAFLLAHKTDGVSDIQLASGLPLRLKSTHGAIRVSLNSQLIITPVPSKLISDYFDSVGVDVKSVTSIGKRVTSRIVMSNKGTDLVQSFRLEAASYSSGTEALSSISVFRPTLAPRSADELDLHPLVREKIYEKEGLIIFIGSTGTGKSTSQAAILSGRLQTSTQTIFSVEDPPEFDFDLVPKSIGVMYQMDLQKDFGGSWEEAEKYLVRVNGDTIMGGEIRDVVSLKFPLNLCRTDHQVFTTLHANRPWGVPGRIINLLNKQEGKDALVEDFVEQIGSIIAQRLIPNLEGGKSCIVDVLNFGPDIKKMILTTLRTLTVSPYHDTHGYRLYSLTDAFRLAIKLNVENGTGVSMDMMLEDLLNKKIISQEVYDTEIDTIDAIVLESILKH